MIQSESKPRCIYLQSVCIESPNLCLISNLKIDVTGNMIRGDRKQNKTSICAQAHLTRHPAIPSRGSPRFSCLELPDWGPQGFDNDCNDGTPLRALLITLAVMLMQLLHEGAEQKPFHQLCRLDFSRSLKLLKGNTHHHSSSTVEYANGLQVTQNM